MKNLLKSLLQRLHPDKHSVCKSTTAAPAADSGEPVFEITKSVMVIHTQETL